MGSAFSNAEFGGASFPPAAFSLDGGRGREAAWLRPDWNDGCCVCLDRAVLFGDVCHVVSNRLASSAIRLSDNDLFCLASRAGVWPYGCKQLFFCPSRRLCDWSVSASDCALQMAKLERHCSRFLRLGQRSSRRMYPLDARRAVACCLLYNSAGGCLDAI